MRWLDPQQGFLFQDGRGESSGRLASGQAGSAAGWKRVCGGSVFNAAPWDESWSIEASLERLSGCAATPDSLGRVAEDDTGIAALATGYWQRYQDERHFHLLEFCVANDRQGEGIGTLLLEALHDRLQSAGVHRFYTLTARETPAQAFYEKRGFYVSPKMILMARRY